MSEVLVSRISGVARLRLNRPTALHALTTAMCSAMIDALLAWREDATIELVLIDHAAGRGFCAGGDIRAAAESGMGDGAAARSFFDAEYKLNHLLFTYAKPIVAFMDGVTMGGGAGIALPARHRVVTERTIFAMPETAIGLFPDVGGGWYLSRLPGRIGQYLALTSARLDGAECLALGLATHHVASAGLEELKHRLIEAPEEAAAILDASATAPPPATILERQREIDRLFASDRLEEIVDALAAEPGAWAAGVRRELGSRSPQACKVALRLLREGARMATFADEMRMEYAVAVHVCQRHDFAEGVRAALVDKDNAPRWYPPSAAGVTDHLIDTIFASLPDDEAWEPLRL